MQHATIHRHLRPAGTSHAVRPRCSRAAEAPRSGSIRIQRTARRGSPPERSARLARSPNSCTSESPNSLRKLLGYTRSNWRYTRIERLRVSCSDELIASRMLHNTFRLRVSKHPFHTLNFCRKNFAAQLCELVVTPALIVH